MYNPPQITKNPQLPVALIAGGAGFIGSHLTEYLLSQGLRVVVIDSLQTGNKDLITQFTGHPRFSFIQYDLNVGIPAKIEGCDFIVDLASEELHLSDKNNLEMDSLVTNALTTRNLLELARNCSAKIAIISSINVYQGAISATNLKNYFGATEEEEKSFSYSESKRYAESLAFEYFKKYKLDVRVIRFGEVYGPRMDLKATSNLGRFIDNVLRGDNLIVHGDGLEKEYYCYISDALDGLSKALFKPGTIGGIFPITDINPITVLELAYLIKGCALPGTQVIFKPKFEDLEIPEVKVIDGKIQRDLKWKPKITLRDGVKLTLESLGFNKISRQKIEMKDESGVTPTENFIPPGRYQQMKNPVKIKWPEIHLNFLKGLNPKKLSKKKIIGTASLIFISAVLLILSPLLKISYHLGMSYWEFRKIESDIREIKTERLTTDIQNMSNQILRAKETLELTPILKDSELPKLLSSVSLVSRAALSASQSVKPLVDIFLRLGFNNSANVSDNKQTEAELTKLSLAFEGLANASDLLDLSRADFKEVNIGKLPVFIANKVPLYARLLTDLNETLNSLNLISQVAPKALGAESARNYLLVFQNSNELRPTGGFIGSLGKIILEKGRLTQVKIIDVYDIDGQIDDRKIEVVQPKFLSDNLKTEYLHIRDANYSPSFPESAERIRELYTQVSNETIDGVIALDLSTIEGLLKITGPIFLPTFNETINENNIFERAQFHSEAAYFPGSTQKKTFLSILAQQLIDNIFSLDKRKYFNLFKEVKNLLGQKHILVYLPDEQSIVSQLNWDGRVLNSTNDYLMVVDTNVGSTKSNYFIERSLDYHLERNNREGEYLSQLRVSYKHNGTSDAWPGGPYKNFLRVFVPKKTALLKVILSENGSSEEGIDITGKTEIGDDLGKTFFSITFTVETGKSDTLVFTYVLPAGTIPLPENRYSLTVQKQPGTKSDGFKFKFKLPFGAVLTPLPENFKSFGDTIEWDGDLSEDRFFDIPLK